MQTEINFEDTPLYTDYVSYYNFEVIDILKHNIILTNIEGS